MGPLNSSNAVDAYLDAIEKAKAAGGTVASGGKALTERKGNFVLPTLITGLDNKAEVVQTETFAPILYVMKYSKLEDAIAMQNDVTQGLSSAIFTPNLQAPDADRQRAASGKGVRERVELGGRGQLKKK